MLLVATLVTEEKELKILWREEQLKNQPTKETKIQLSVELLSLNNGKYPFIQHLKHDITIISH